MRKAGWFIGCLTLAMCPLPLFPQCMLYPVSLNERIDEAQVILEGKIISSKSYWRANPNLIYTSWLVDVYKCLKGNFSSTKFELITEGGIVGNEMLVVSSETEIFEGMQGVFMLKTTAFPALMDTQNSFCFQTVSGPSGFFLLDKKDNSFSSPFLIFQPVQALFDSIEARVLSPAQIIQYPVIQQSSNLFSGPPPPAVNVTSFSPDTVTAGTFDTLTITGTGFGASYSGSANVEFKDANSGGAGYIAAQSHQIISWSDTEVKVFVRTRAGTGTIRVTGVDATQFVTAASLVVTYNITNITSSSIDYICRPVDNSGSGSYIFTYNQDFADSTLAVASFERAIVSWRCGTGFNISTSASTSALVAQASDGVNLVTFDGSSALPGSVLGTCYSFYSACFVSSAWRWSLAEIDVKMRTNNTGGINWNYGPAASGFTQYDFESVSLHEVGHGHQLGHIINSGKVMHYAISNGSDQRTLHPDHDIAGGDYVMVLATATELCGWGEMIAINPCNCSLNPNGGAGTWTWTGTNSSDWFCTGNWDIGTTPDADSDVVIPGGTTNDPTITGAAASCNTITIQTATGGILNINTAGGGSLNVIP